MNADKHTLEDALLRSRAMTCKSLRHHGTIFCVDCLVEFIIQRLRGRR